MSDSQLQLKITPPRSGRDAAVRQRLEQRWTEVHDRTAIIVTAPQGLGKTTLLVQWRRNWLEQGAYVAWASLDAQDDRWRFVHLLLFALRAATAREAFATAATEGLMHDRRELDALTIMLAEVAALAKPTVVVLDDAHRMPRGAMSELLAYLLNNAPPNLHFLIGTRRPLDLKLADLVAAGQIANVTASDLQFTLEESLAVLRGRFGSRISLDDAARLHDLTEGWPLGLQLAAVSIERSRDLHETIGRLSARRGDLQRYFLESLLPRLPSHESAFLVRISILEALNAELCAAVSGDPQAAVYLERMAGDSPLVSADEEREWLHLHSMARDFLLGQFDKLPAEERRACHERAATWYARRRRFRDAARHALAAGDDALAVEHASRCLLDIAREGRLAEAHDWMKRLPPSVMARDLRLQLSAAWIMALGVDAASVPAMIEKMSHHQEFTGENRFIAALVTAAAAFFCDKPGLSVNALKEWESAPPGADPLQLASLANSHATLALHRGDTAEVRRRLAQLPADGSRDTSLRLVQGFSDLLLGASHLLDGDPARVVALLQPRLEAAEREMGRRSSLAAMLSGWLAAALFLLDRPEQALATLAGRLDVIERTRSPDTVLLAYGTLAAVALRAGEEARALEILKSLRELGLRHDLPRAVLVSLMEQTRVHSLHGRAETAAGLLSQIDALEAVFRQPSYEPFQWLFRLQRGVAAGYAALARLDFEAAESALQAALQLPVDLHRHPLVLVARALLVLAAHELNRPGAAAMLNEVLSLADLAGLRGFVLAAHPQLAAMSGTGASSARTGTATSGAAAAPARLALQPPSGLLTPKEARILALLSAGRANKEIARAMDIGEQTVKWHLKNLFSKLNAASRTHAVDRARLLGLLEG